MASAPNTLGSWVRDTLLVAAAFLLCPLVALLAPEDPAGPIAAAQRLEDAQAALGLSPEAPWSQWLAQHHDLAVGTGLFYVWGHLPMLVGTLVFLRLNRPERWFVRARNAFVVTQLIVIAGYVLAPTAPPRLADPAVVDVVAKSMGHDVGGMSGVLQSPYAAMPSGHVAFAVIVALALSAEPWRSVRIVGALYPVAVTLLVIATGNHYLFDAVAGALAALVGWRVAGVLARRRAAAQSTRTYATPSSISTSKVSTGM